MEECRTLGGCKTGYAKITKGYDLPCKYVIHAVGPRWALGTRREAEKLESCYRESLKLAAEHGCKSVAFPLISTGAYGYPKEKALKIAVNAITEFLEQNEITVYLVVYDKDSFQISKKRFQDIKEYVDGR